jgi:hypothetical protein
MKISNYFTDWELKMALHLLSDILSDKDAMENLSVEYDAGDRFVDLLRKIKSYKTEV